MILHLPPTCRGCGDEPGVHQAGADWYCAECHDFLAGIPPIENEEPYVPSRTDVLRDRDEEARCHGDD